MAGFLKRDRQRAESDRTHGITFEDIFGRLPIKSLDLYMLKSFLGPFLLTFSIVTFILMLQFLWLYIDELVGKGLGFWVIIQFMGWGSCTLIPLALPLATLLGSIMTMGSLGENNELLAMKSAGISLPRILRPLMWVALFIVIGAFFASNNLIPVAYNKIYTLREDIAKTKEEIKIPVGVFYNGIDGYNIRVTSRDKNNLMHGIMIYDHNKENGNRNLTLADSGRFAMTPDKKGLLISLYNGINYQEDNKYSYADTTLNLQKIKFTYQRLAIPLENYSFKKSSEGKYSSEVMARNLSQLKNDRDSLRTEDSVVITAQIVRAIRGDSFSHADQLDSSRNKGYTESFKPEELLKWKDTEEEKRAYEIAASALKSEIQSCSFYEAQIQQIEYPLRRNIIESFRKFTLSFACLIFFFIGAPIGAIVRKGGIGTPAIISILFFVLYWVVDISGKKLANDGAISPFIGSFISTLILVPLAWFLTWKSTKDSAMFNPETYFKGVKNFFARIFSKAQRIRQRMELKEQRRAAEKEDAEWHARENAQKAEADKTPENI
ncbi:MAG: LptF/LptG family permease [Candidatus Egerieousia sp.]